MTWLLLALRVVLVLSYTLGCYLTLIVGRALLWLVRRSSQHWSDEIYRLWGAGMTRLLGIRVDVRGPTPPRPFLLVSNHLSYVDIFLLAGLFGCVFVAKSEIARWPLIGHLCRAVGTIFVDRQSRRDALRVGTQIHETLAAGRSVVVFPEGTTSGGETVEPFKASLLAPAAAQEVPVYGAALSYQTPADVPPARLSVCWWADMQLVPHLFGLFRLPSFCASVNFAEAPIQDSDRKRLARRLHTAILAKFTPVTGSEDGCNLKNS